jgi:hypothetical protein
MRNPDDNAGLILHSPDLDGNGYLTFHSAEAATAKLRPALEIQGLFPGGSAPAPDPASGTLKVSALPDVVKLAEVGASDWVHWARVQEDGTVVSTAERDGVDRIGTPRIWGLPAEVEKVPVRMTGEGETVLEGGLVIRPPEKDGVSIELEIGVTATPTLVYVLFAQQGAQPVQLTATLDTGGEVRTVQTENAVPGLRLLRWAAVPEAEGTLNLKLERQQASIGLLAAALSEN